MFKFKKHEDLEGRHAVLSPSRYSWANYTNDDQLYSAYKSYGAAQRGTELHEFAKNAILLEQNLPRTRKTLNMFVNDAIRYHMTPEQMLYYSRNCFGTADAICFDERSGFLRIHDLKTGVTTASMTQLHIYAALFCLEYNVDPVHIEIETRIYQNDDVLIDETESEGIIFLMNRIVEFDEKIDGFREGGL